MRNQFATAEYFGAHPRRLFKAVVTEQKLDVDVFLGQPISRGEQLACR